MNFSNPTPPFSDRSLRLLGVQAQNFPWLIGDGNVSLVSQTTRFGYLPLLAGDIVTNLHFWVDVVASGVTTIKAGIYQFSTGTTWTRLASSSNLTSSLGTLNLATLALSSPYTVPTSGHYLAALLSHATTPGSVLAGATAGVTGKGSGTIWIGGSEAGQTDLDASADVGASSVSIWVGWS